MVKPANFSGSANSDPSVQALNALSKAERFMSGFEDDETQEGVAENLAEIRAAIAVLRGLGPIAHGAHCSPTFIDVGPVDWALLRTQKNFISQIQGRTKTAEEEKATEGLLSFLDHIQDEAAKVVGEKTVFCAYTDVDGVHVPLPTDDEE